MGKHTPGGWQSHPHKEQDNPKRGYIVIQQREVNAKNIATIIPCAGMTTEEVEANAKLIAAAPALLKALINARDFITRCDDWWGPDPEMDLIVSAIQEATE